MKTFNQFILENTKFPKAPNGWEFSVEEITHILQDFIDDGMKLRIWEVRALVEGDDDIAPICITVTGTKSFFKDGEERLSKKSKRIIDRLKEFKFSDIFYDKETHYGTVTTQYGESDDMFLYQNIYINDCVDEKYFGWNKRSNIANEQMLWKSSIEELTNILQDFIDEGMDLKFKDKDDYIDILISYKTPTKEGDVRSVSYSTKRERALKEIKRQKELIIDQLDEFGFKSISVGNSIYLDGAFLHIKIYKSSQTSLF